MMEIVVGTSFLFLFCFALYCFVLFSFCSCLFVGVFDCLLGCLFVCLCVCFFVLYNVLLIHGPIKQLNNIPNIVLD